MRLSSLLSSACLSLLLALAACAAPSASPDAPGPALPEQSPSPDRDGRTAAATMPAPEAPAAPRVIRRPGAPASGAAILDYSCSSDNDCAVKNVGNCCGYYPACVNVDSPTFPKQVQAECEREGRMSICGYPEISACRCVEQRCEAATGAAAALE